MADELPNSEEQLTDYLNDYQGQLLSASDSVETRADYDIPQIRTTRDKTGQQLIFRGTRYIFGSPDEFHPYSRVSEFLGLPYGPENLATEEEEALPAKGISELGLTPEELRQIGEKALAAKSQTGLASSLPMSGEISVGGGTAQLPETINYAKLRQDLRTNYGVSALESQLNDINAAIRETEAAKRTRSIAEEGKPVAMNVIAGRVSEIERQENERLSALTRQASYVADQLNTKYNVINTMMSDLRLTYTDAVGRYEMLFDQAMQIQSAARAERQLEISEQQFEQDTARANLSILVNSALGGNLSYSSLPEQTKTEIAKLEAQAGLPSGTIANLQMDAGANVLFTTSNEGITQVGIRNPDGTISVQSYGTRISSGGTASERQKAEYDYYVNFAKQDAESGVTLAKMFSIYSGILSPDEIYLLYNANSIYGPAKESAKQLAKYGVTILKED